MVNRFRDSFHRKTFLFLTANDAGWRGSGSHTSMTEHVTHRVTHTHTRFHSLCFAPFVSLTLCLPLCSALSQPPREGSEEMEREREKKWSVSSESSLLSVSLFSLPRPPSYCLLAPVSGMSWRCLRGVPAPSAKPIDPLITCCSTSFREEQVCTCRIYILTQKTSTL